MLEGALQDAPPAVDDGGAPPVVTPRGGGGEPSRGPGSDPARFGLWAFLGTVTMLFMGFTSAYVVRRVSLDWRPIRPPGLLWANTAALALSSLALETARRRLRAWDLASARRWLAGVGALGALFLAGQLGAWRALAAEGVFLSSNPHSSFFYLLTGLHGAHLLGGLIWFLAAWWRLRAPAVAPGHHGLGLFATYWHFLGLLWLYLVVLLFVI